MPTPLDYEHPPDPPERSRLSEAIANANAGRGGGASVGLLLMTAAALVLIEAKGLNRDGLIAAIATLLLGLYLFQDGLRVLRRTRL